MKTNISSLLRPFFADPGVSCKPDDKNAEHTFVTAGYRWGSKEAQDKALTELKEFANWVRIDFNDKGNPRTMMSLPFTVEAVKAFCAQQALSYQSANAQPPLDERDVAGYAVLQADGSVRIDIERAVAADRARELLNSPNWAKDDDFVSVVLRGLHCRAGVQPVQVYVRLMNDIIVGVYDRARADVIVFGMEPAEMVA